MVETNIKRYMLFVTETTLNSVENLVTAFAFLARDHKNVLSSFEVGCSLSGKTRNKSVTNTLFFYSSKNVCGVSGIRFAVEKTVNADTMFSTDTDAYKSADETLHNVN